MGSGAAALFTIFMTCIGVAIGVGLGVDMPSAKAEDRILCEDRCATAKEKLLTVAAGRECICTTARIALPGRSVP